MNSTKNHERLLHVMEVSVIIPCQIFEVSPYVRKKNAALHFSPFYVSLNSCTKTRWFQAFIRPSPAQHGGPPSLNRGQSLLQKAPTYIEKMQNVYARQCYYASHQNFNVWKLLNVIMFTVTLFWETKIEMFITELFWSF